ncbi:MAG: rhodanese-like domain-containing protein [Gammaproteobacteria bacterium]|nr:rhodanese-like domain-containing protein [Gammaproteobacteria bacterium]
MNVVSFYRFFEVVDPETTANRLRTRLENLDLVGTLLIANEGVNASLAHQDLDSLKHAVQLVETSTGTSSLRAKYSTARPDNPVFYRLKVKVRDEIIQFGKPLTSSDPLGVHVQVNEWNELLDDPDVLVLDIRNDYEIEAGAFENAVPIGIGRFAEFGSRIESLLEAHGKSTIAMYCTGGIRCEKASNALLASGCEAVYQLDGGVLGYLETVKPNESRWHGECFVFDQRVSVDAKLSQGSYDQCHACRRATSEEHKQSKLYVKSVSCPYCFHETSAQQKAQFTERAKQEALANARGKRHLGALQP